MKKLIILFAMFSFSKIVSAQNLDLSTGQGTTITQTIDPMTITSFTVTNRLAKIDAIYSVKVLKTIMNPPALPTQGFLSADNPGDCGNLLTALNALDDETDEANIPAKISLLQSEIKKADKTKCKNTIRLAELSIASTFSSISLPVAIKVESGEMLKITIKRGDKTWNYELQTEQDNHWKAYFGFTFSPDILTKFDHFYAKSDTGTSFIVARSNAKNKNTFSNLSPTVLLTYQFYKKKDAPFKFGLTGGFKYNLETLGALFGPSIVIGDNVSLTVGITTLQKDRLRGQYVEGQRLKETLDFDQLHEKVWTYDLFFSVGFSISELFKKSEPKAKSATVE
jgi:hypothetical protein